MSNSKPRGLPAVAFWTTLWVASSAALLASACGSAGASPPGDARQRAAVEDGPVSYETIYQTQQSAIEEERMETVLDAAALGRVWSALRAEGPPPEIDFEREMAILAATGTRADTCYRVEIAAIDATAGGLAVEVADVVPRKDCMCGMAITHPAQLVRLPRYDGPVSFTVVRKPHDCS